MRLMRVLMIMSLLFLLFSCGKEDDRTSASPGMNYDEEELPPLSVEFMEVQKGRLIPHLELSTVLHGINEVNVISQTQGPIEEVPVKMGDYVNKNDIIVQVDSSIAWLNLKAAQEQWATAQIDFEALDRSIDQGGSSRIELSAARNRLAAAEAALEAARQNYENCQIRAPIDGYVSSMARSISPGNRLSPGTPIAMIIDDSYWLLESYLGERQIGLITPDAKVEAWIPSLSTDRYPAEIYAIASGGDPSTGSYKVQIRWPNEVPGALSGMTAMAQIWIAKGEENIIIPLSSLVKREGKDFVYVEKEGKAQPLEIQAGSSLGNRLSIIQGLNEGDHLIISGLNQLTPGRSVQTTLISNEEALE